MAIRTTTNQTPSGTTHFVHDLMGNVIAETDGSGAAGTVRDYIWLPETEISPTFGSRTVVDRPLAVVDGVNATPVTWYVHADHLNRPIKMTDGSKASVWTAVWSPWGSPHSITGTATLDARFPGQWYQLEAGLHYNWHRSYDPTLGRYTQPDPLGFVDGPSVFGYATSSPQSAIDPEGLAKRRPGERRRSCRADEWKQCRSRCGSKGVDGCYVQQSISVTRITHTATGEPLVVRTKKETLECSCKGEPVPVPPPLPQSYPGTDPSSSNRQCENCQKMWQLVWTITATGAAVLTWVLACVAG